MPTIRIITNRRSSLVARHQELLENLKLVAKSDLSEFVVMEADFATPISVVPLAAAISSRGMKCFCRNRYLNNIRFPYGVDVDAIAQKEKRLYIPVISISLSSFPVHIRNEKLQRLSDRTFDLLRDDIPHDDKFLEWVTRTVIGLLVGEMTANIHEHSNARNVYLLADYWGDNGTCEICIVDDGQGILGSLRQAGREVQNSRDALFKVITNQLSAKDEYGIITRGTGILSMRRLLVNPDIKGAFSILSGDALFVDSFDGQPEITRFSNYEWDGTIVSMTLARPNRPIRFSDYVF